MNGNRWRDIWPTYLKILATYSVVVVLLFACAKNEDSTRSAYSGQELRITVTPTPGPSLRHLKFTIETDKGVYTFDGLAEYEPISLSLLRGGRWSTGSIDISIYKEREEDPR